MNTPDTDSTAGKSIGKEVPSPKQNARQEAMYACASESKKSGWSSPQAKYYRAFASMLVWVLLSAILLYNYLTTRAELTTLRKGQEATLEQMHQLGYDDGYVSAIWDTYLNVPEYMIVEGHDEPQLWKRMPVSDAHKKKISTLDPYKVGPEAQDTQSKQETKK